jgi:tryptophan-rich sensory protein
MLASQRITKVPRAILVLAGFLAATFAVAGVSSVFTIKQIPAWYATLVKPSFNPPNQIFGPVWTLLYTLMAIAAWRVWRLPSSRLRTRGLWLFWVQLGLNFAWSFLFFGEHRIGLAAVEIVLLWGTILATMIYFFRLDRLAGVFFALYLAWVSFAAVLNLSIWLKNG